MRLLHPTLRSPHGGLLSRTVASLVRTRPRFRNIHRNFSSCIRGFADCERFHICSSSSICSHRQLPTQPFSSEATSSGAGTQPPGASPGSPGPEKPKGSGEEESIPNKVGGESNSFLSRWLSPLASMLGGSESAQIKTADGLFASCEEQASTGGSR